MQLKDLIISEMAAKGIGQDDPVKMKKFAAAMDKAMNTYLNWWLSAVAKYLSDTAGTPPSPMHVYTHPGP
jgi:hypothetical protein